jgi:hypothetical protein
MLRIGSGVLALVVFVGLSESARRGSTGARSAATLEAMVLLPLAGLGAYVALVLMSLKCDDGCAYEGPAPWRLSPDAWQWTGQFVVAALGLAAVGSAIALLWARRYRWAAALMTLATASFGAWAALLAPFGDGVGI